jgi:cation diffusion facilitator family transporter
VCKKHHYTYPKQYWSDEQTSILTKQIMKKNRVVLISIISNTSLIIFKIVAGVLMGSVAVISEAIHSGIDLLAAVIAFIAIRKADEPADQDHPFGHGKFENISGIFEAMLIFTAAGLIIYEAVKKLLHPIMVENLGWGIGVMAVSTIVNIVVSRILFKSAKKYGSIALEADAMHLWVDVFTSVGVMVGLVLIRLTHWEVLDPVIAILVAGLILKVSFDLTTKAVSDLADRRLPDEEINSIHAIINGTPQVESFHKLRTRKSGSRREIDIHIQVDKRTSLSNAHDLCFHIEKAIKTELPGAYVTIHVEPGGREQKE